MIITNDYKYFMADMFDPSHFIEVSEDFFDNTVVRFCDQYIYKRLSDTVTLFINKSNVYDIVKRVLVGGKFYD